MNIEKYTEELITLRHYFHQHPELALQEVETSAYIRKYLEKLGYEIVPIEPTGLIAELPSLRNREKLVVLRAEMDALPIQEQTNLPYASVNQGCMHACGHDMILAAALILAKIVAEEQRMQESFPVRLRFLFEPAEEIGEGAKRMLQAGALENPKADAFLMFHYAADMTFGMAVHQGQASSMINSMQIHVHGKSSHWCEADKGIDAIYAAAQVISAIHDLNESFGKQHPDAGKYIVGTGTIHGGEYTNIIADHVVLNGNIRAVHEETYMALEHELERNLQEIESRLAHRSVWNFQKIRYMRLPMMRNLQRQQRQWVKKYSEINLFWKEKMSCFFPVTTHTDILEKPEDFSQYFLREYQERIILCIIRNFNWMREYCRTAWRHCIRL